MTEQQEEEEKTRLIEEVTSRLQGWKQYFPKMYDLCVYDLCVWSGDSMDDVYFRKIREGERPAFIVEAVTVVTELDGRPPSLVVGLKTETGGYFQLRIPMTYVEPRGSLS